MNPERTNFVQEYAEFMNLTIFGPKFVKIEMKMIVNV